MQVLLCDIPTTRQVQYLNLKMVHKIGPPGRIHKIGSPAGRFKAELNIWHELELGFWCCVKLHTQFQVTPHDATSNSGKTR